MKFASVPFHRFVTHDEWIKRHSTKDTPLSHLPTIPEFYADREIFVTGFSGFIGKVLIEKLLRSCSRIKTIFVLLRPKRGQSIEERLESLTSEVVFDVLRHQNPNFAEKIVPVKGDVTELGLGMSEDDVNRLKNVSIVFHSAASVRFDDPLKYAVLVNVRGTREIMKFAEELPDIKVVMHVSTTYSNVHLETVEEKIYPPLADWEKTIKICEDYDQAAVDILTQHYINFMPNTYVFSKNLAEHVSYSYRQKLPIIVIRPSIVLSSFSEPFAGYVDNFNGPMGILLASSIGIVKTMYCDENNIMDLTPVDVCVKAMIVSAWKRAHETENELSVINAASASEIRATISQIVDMGKNGLIGEIPMGRKMLTIPSGGVTMCKTWNLIRTVFCQLILAVLVDVVMKINGKKLRLMKIQRKIYDANRALLYFASHNWDFKNDNFLSLCSFLRHEDIKAFDYRLFFNSDVIGYTRVCLYGFRRYLMRLKDEDLPKDRQRFQFMNFVTQSVQIGVISALICWIYFKYF